MNLSRSLRSVALLLLALTNTAPRAAGEAVLVLSSDTAVDTRAIDLAAPASGSVNASPLEVTFYLPRNATANTIKLIFTGNVTRELWLSSAFDHPGTHHLTFDSGNPTDSVAILSGDTIPDGVYTLRLSYQDESGALLGSNASTNVAIDRTAPLLVVPADIAVAATSDAGATVPYPPATASDALGVASLTYSKPTGSQFPIGVTNVTVIARDAAGHTTVGTFTITVNGTQIAVEQPAGTDLQDAAPAPLDFGTVPAGGSKSLTFVIRNLGTFDLSGIAVTKALTGTPGDFTIDTPASATLAPAAASAFTVTFSPSAAGTRTTTLLIANNDPDENPFEIHLTGRQMTALQAWRVTYFGSPDNAGPGADLHDGDGDGIVNLLEFATATNPTVSTPPPGQLVKFTDQLEFTYTRPTAATAELSYTPETSDILTGSWMPADPAATKMVSDDGILQQIKFTVPANSREKLFVRLRVTRP